MMFTCTVDGEKFETQQNLKLHIIDKHIEVACMLFAKQFVKEGAV